MSSYRGTIGEVEISPATEGGSQSGYSSVEWRIADLCSYTTYCGESFKSDSFECAGKRWHIKLEIGQIISALLVMESSLPSLQGSVQFKLDLKKADGTLKGNEKWITFTTISSCQYSRICYFESELKKCETRLGPTRIVTFVCCFKNGGLHNVSQPASAMKIYANPQRKRKFTELVDASTQTQSENCTEKLSRDINELLLSGEDSNLTVQVKGVEFRLHRGIMGVRTPVFAAMLKHSMKKKTSGIVSINDCEVEVFQEFVHYVYNGRVHELSANTAFGLFALADKYQVDELKSVCFEFIRGSLSVDTFCDVVTLALTYSQKQLLQQATDFFAQNMEEILETVKWTNFIKHNVIQANNLILTAVKKIKQ